MNERSTRQPDVTPDASRPFLRHESDRDLLVQAAAALDRVIVGGSLSQRLSAWVDLMDWARSGPGAGELDDTGLRPPAQLHARFRPCSRQAFSRAAWRLRAAAARGHPGARAP